MQGTSRTGIDLLHMAGRAIVALGLLSLALPRLAVAQSVADIAHLAGPDRLRVLTDAGRTEGTLTLYSSAENEDMAPIIAAFEAKTGIKVRSWRNSSEDIRRRVITEMRAGRADVDVIETAGPDLEAIQREGFLQEIVSPTLADLSPLAIRPHREWVGSRFSPYVAAYNTTLIRQADAPKTYEDLLSPKWKGKLGIEVEDSRWFMTLAGAIGEDRATDLLRRIVQTNGISVRKGHTLLTNLVVSGEVPLALTVYDYKASQLMHQGAPIQRLVLPPLVVLTTGIAVSRRAPHPNAAILFWEFFLTEGQKILLAQDNLPTNIRVHEMPKDVVMLDPARDLDEGTRWSRVYHDLLQGKSR